MVIDKILDRKDGIPYNAKQFYNEMMNYGAYDIATALDSGENKDVQTTLCDYIIINSYDPNICDYIKAQEWI